MTGKTGQISLDKLIRKERGERLFCGVAPGGVRALVFHFAAPSSRIGREVEQRLEQFRLALSALSTPHVPALLAWEMLDGVLAFGVEDAEGVVLAEMFEEGERLALPQALGLLDLLLAALAPLHKMGLTYGLNHPSKLVVDRKGRLVLAEPAVMPVLSLLTPQDLTYAGSLFKRLFVEPEFVPPELLRERGASPASDVYQAAVLFHRLVSGVSPFGEGMSLEIYNRMLKGQARHLAQDVPGLPRSLSNAIAECLHPDPELRPADAVAMRRKVAGAVAEGKGSVAELLMREPSRRYSERFTQILEVHTGGSGKLDEFEQSEEERALAEADREVLLGQLDQLRSSRRGVPAKGGAGAGLSRKTTVWLLVAVLGLAGIVAAPYLFPGSGSGSGARPHEGGLPEGSDGLKHHELVRDGQTNRYHPTVRSLLESIPLELKERLRELKVPLAGKLSLVPPVLPPYRLSVRLPSGEEVTLEFTARNRLHSVVRTNPLYPEGVKQYAVLYDGNGKPRMVLSLDTGGAVLNSTQVLPFGDPE